MTNLSERYVQAVVRAVPAAQRADLEPEIRALVADAIEAKTAETELTDAEAERAALTDLGDPAVLAAGYTGRTAYLIGPSLYPEWRRILSVLLPIIVPIAIATPPIVGVGALCHRSARGGTTAPLAAARRRTMAPPTTVDAVATTNTAARTVSTVV